MNAVVARPVLASAAPNPSPPDDAKPTPIESLQEIVRPEDYPPEALARNQQGNVGIRIRVDETGAVRDCVVQESSGYASLDVQTCRLVWMRAKFRPARDTSGKPIAANTYAKIGWRIGKDAKLANSEPWSARVIVTYAPGKPVVCRFEYEGAARGLPKEVENCPTGAAAAKEFTADGISLIELISERGLTVGEKPKPHTGPNEEVISELVVETDVDAAGKLLSCKTVEKVGTPGKDVPVDLCSQLSKAYNPRTDAHGEPIPFAAYLYFATYARIYKAG